MIHITKKVHPFTHRTYLLPNPHPTLVRDGDGYKLPSADAYARRIAEEAEAWLYHVRERSRMREATLVSKALTSVAFTMRHRAHDFAVPSKLSGTSKRQPVLWAMVKDHVALGARLDVEERQGEKRLRLVVSHEGEQLGEVSKHVPWLRPLIPFGATVHLVRVTGTESDYTLGCNIAFGRVGGAVMALNHALGTDTGSEEADAYGGDELPQGRMRLVVHPAPRRGLDPHDGDGAVGVSQPPIPSLEEVIRFWRDEHGVLQMNIPHVKRHSPTGPEIGYNGSGPADAALSVLCSVTSRGEAEQMYQLYKHEVIAQLPENGGAVTKASVRRWLAEKRNER